MHIGSKITFFNITPEMKLSDIKLQNIIKKITAVTYRPGNRRHDNLTHRLRWHTL
jgi:hypothetical protein